MSPSFLLPLQALITNDAVVLGLLASALGLVFYTHSLPQFKRFYTFVPALLMCYFIPAALNSLGVVNGEESNLYFVASRYLLPASLILLCLSIDLKGIYNLGPKAIVMFFAATAGIIVGGPLALWLVSQSDAGVLGGDAPDAYWRGLSTVAGSWIGGGANQAALKEISGTLDDQFSIMLIVDVFVANLWMPFLLFGAGIREKIDGWLKADASAVNELQDKVEQLQSKSARIASFPDWMVIVALAFGGVAVAHLVADSASVSLAHWGMLQLFVTRTPAGFFSMTARLMSLQKPKKSCRLTVPPCMNCTCWTWGRGNGPRWDLSMRGWAKSNPRPSWGLGR